MNLMSRIGLGLPPFGARLSTWLFITMLLLLSDSSLTLSTEDPMRCNSLPELCNLKFNEVSFAGTHNSGSGFDGSLRECDGSIVGDCIWRHQELNITEQLNLGIRFLEIDLCLLPDYCNSSVYDTVGNSSLFTCYIRDIIKIRYAGPIFKLFQQVNDWMLENPYDVIGLYFPADFPEGQGSQIFSELQAMLENFWLCSDDNFSVCMSTHFNTHNEWPTLNQTILSRERIFVFIDPKLVNDTEDIPWNHPSIFSTYVKPTQDSNFCMENLLTSADLCNTTADILIEAGVNLGICIINGQIKCNEILRDATKKCYDLRSSGTINVVAVDFPNSTVLDVVNYLNEQNIAKYTYSPVTTNSPISSLSPTTLSSSCKAVIGSVHSILTLVVFLLYLF